jgi:hypothetical protein
MQASIRELIARCPCIDFPTPPSHHPVNAMARHTTRITLATALCAILALCAVAESIQSVAATLSGIFSALGR